MDWWYIWLMVYIGVYLGVMWIMGRNPKPEPEPERETVMVDGEEF